MQISSVREPAWSVEINNGRWVQVWWKVGLHRFGCQGFCFGGSFGSGLFGRLGVWIGGNWIGVGAAGPNPSLTDVLGGSVDSPNRQ